MFPLRFFFRELERRTKEGKLLSLRNIILDTFPGYP
jgi:hypothetical protein